MAKHHFAFLLEILAVADPSRAGAEHRLKQSPAVDERRVPQVEAVQVKEVERIVEEPVGQALAERGLQRREVRCAGSIFDDEFAVDQRLAHRKRLERRDHGLAEFRRPVEPTACEQGEAALVDARLDPVAVELDLVQPA